jgi:hypothetical protein
VTITAMEAGANELHAASEAHDHGGNYEYFASQAKHPLVYTPAELVDNALRAMRMADERSDDAHNVTITTGGACRSVFKLIQYPTIAAEGRWSSRITDGTTGEPNNYLLNTSVE